MKHRKIKSEIAFYLQNFDQIEYREYVDRQTRDCCRIIEKESGNKQHTDYFLNYYVPKVKIYDILSNDGMTKLVNSLYKLSPQKYKVFNVLYRKPTILHKYDYVHMQKEHCFLGRLAEVQFIDSKYIKSIDIIIVAISTTRRIKKHQLKDFGEQDIIEIYLDDCKDNNITYIKQLQNYRKVILDELEALGRKNYPHLNQINLVASIPSCMSLEIGRMIAQNNNRVKKIVAYHFVNQGTKLYPFGIAVTESQGQYKKGELIQN